LFIQRAWTGYFDESFPIGLGLIDAVENLNGHWNFVMKVKCPKPALI